MPDPSKTEDRDSVLFAFHQEPMKSNGANEQGNTATGKMSGEVGTLPNDSLHRLAYVLKAIEDEEMRFAEARTEHKDNMERLVNLAYKIRQEILSGQFTLLRRLLRNSTPAHTDTGKVKVTAEVK